MNLCLSQLISECGNFQINNCEAGLYFFFFFSADVRLILVISTESSRNFILLLQFIIAHS